MLLELLVLYWMVSAVLFFFPKLLHPAKLNYAKRVFLKPGKIVGVSHRGGMLEGYDNSMSSFEHSLKVGIKMIEMDVYRTKDGKFVVAHDLNLQRITGQPQLISEINYDDILPFKDEIYCDYGLSYARPNINKEKPCLLEDFIAFVKKNDVIANLDVKTGKVEDIDVVLNMASEAGIIHRLVVGAIADFDPMLFRKKYGDELSFFFPAKAAFMIFIYFFTGLLPFIPLKYDFYNIPFYFKTLENGNFMREWKRTKVFLQMLLKIKPIFKLLIKHLQARNIPITYFVVNKIDDFKLAIECNANALMTDRPQKLMDYLKLKELC